jgi:glyoxylase-like metal-dependent hydrolase (beta-lactamase superfamily II)
MNEIAPNVFWLGFNVSGAYLVGERGGQGPWVVVDTSMPGHFEVIKAAAEELYGLGAKPDAIILTHGHVDHYGSALALAAYWNVPVYAHPMELPYLTGKACLPPLDPTVGGFFALVSRMMPTSGTDLGEFVRSLPEDGTVPGMPGWRWIATPGHTPGHVSLFRDSDRTLIAGDAVTTVDADDAVAMITKRQQFARPVTAAVSDWPAARRSLEALSALRPTVVAAGHGVPMTGPDVAEELATFAGEFRSPQNGRYVAEPARFDENGIVFLPPPAPDPLPKIAAGIAVTAALVAVAAYYGTKKRRAPDDE